MIVFEIEIAAFKKYSLIYNKIAIKYLNIK
jgi:hypothetical protein